MKLKYILLSLGIMSLTSCNNLLEVDPYTFSSGESYYQNEGQILRAVNGVYSRVQSIYTSDFFALTEMVADNTNYQFNPTDRGSQQREEIDEFLITSSNNYVNTAWANLFSLVQQANVVLTKIDDVPFSDDTLKERFKGEMKFLRAFGHFHLVRLFGEIPLHLVAVEGPTNAFSEKSSVDEVYTAIIQDLKDASNTLPVKYGSGDVGRVTKGAALTMLGDVYLTLKQYSDAVTALQEVTTFGYALMSNYADCFDPNAKNNAESIFEVQYDQAIEGENSNFIYMFGPIDGRVKLVGFTGNLGGSNIPTPSIYNAYENGDTRKDKSISLFDDPTSLNYPESVAFGGKIPFIKKFYHAPYIENGRSDENWPVYRYGHALLLLAEAMHEAKSGDPYTYLNQVRRRAGLSDLAGLSDAQLREAIAKEQRVEVAFENHRWYQLLRTGKAMEIMNAHGVEEKQRLSRLSGASYKVEAYKLLFPIPSREVQINGITQNPGY